MPCSPRARQFTRNDDAPCRRGTRPRAPPRAGHCESLRRWSPGVLRGRCILFGVTLTVPPGVAVGPRAAVSGRGVRLVRRRTWRRSIGVLGVGVLLHEVLLSTGRVWCRRSRLERTDVCGATRASEGPEPGCGELRQRRVGGGRAVGTGPPPDVHASLQRRAEAAVASAVPDDRALAPSGRPETVQRPEPVVRRGGPSRRPSCRGNRRAHVVGDGSERPDRCRVPMHRG